MLNCSHSGVKKFSELSGRHLVPSKFSHIVTEQLSHGVYIWGIYIAISSLTAYTKLWAHHWDSFPIYSVSPNWASQLGQVFAFSLFLIGGPVPGTSCHLQLLLR